jgi:AraC-like DNA-binding protein/CheY-like chemotaxis protein
MMNKNLLLPFPKVMLNNVVAQKRLLIMDSNSSRGNHLLLLLSDHFSVQLVKSSMLVPESIGNIPDVIFIDLNFSLPGTIEEFISNIRCNPRHSQTILVLLTDAGNGSGLLSALQAGAHTYIMYPIDPALLLLTVEKLATLKDRYTGWSDTWLTPPSLLQLEPMKPHLYEDAFRKRFEEVIAKYIEEEIPSVQKISSEMSQSIATLGRWVKKIYGVTPKKYIMDHKLYIAEMMLRHRSGAVRDIAYKLGFHSVSYFCYLFKERYGCSPGSLLGKPRD